METVNPPNAELPDDDGLKELTTAAQLEPSNARAQNTLGNWYYDHGQYEQAIVQFEKASKANPAEWIYESNIGDSYRSLKNWDKAIEHYQDAAKGAASGGDWIYNGLGLAYYCKADYEHAIQSYQKAVQAKPEPTYYVNLADACRLAGNLDDAIDYCQNAIAMDGSYSPAYNSVGIAYALKQEYPDAIQSLQKAISLDSKERIYYVNLGDVYRVQGDSDKALEQYGRAIALDPNDHETLNAMGVAYVQKADYQEAINYYNRALNIRKIPVYYANLGNAYRNLGDWEKSISNYRRALELDPEDHLTYNSLGVVYNRQGKYQQAIQFYEKARAIFPNPIYVVNIGDSYQALGKIDEAIKHFELGLELAVDSGMDATLYRRTVGLAYNQIGVTYYGSGDNEKALAAYQKAVTFITDDDIVFHNLFLVLKEQQRYADAESALKKAIEVCNQVSGAEKYASYRSELEEVKRLAAGAQTAGTL